MSLGERIREQRESLGLSRKDLADMIGVTASAIANYENAISSPKADLLFPLMDALKCDANYLYRDEMDALGGSSIKLQYDEMEHIKKYRALDDYAKGTVDIILDRESKRPQSREAADQPPEEPKPQKKVVPLPKAKRNRSGMVEIKVYDQPAAAGLGNYLDEPAHHEEQYPDDVIPFHTDFGVVISGDSMEPKIHDGGIVFVQAAPSIDPGKIGIFVLNGQAYCKRLVVDHEKRQVRLVSLNQNYDDIVVGEFDSFRTVGLVLGQWTRGHANDDIFGW